MAQYRATLAYDGAAYQGFQRQRDGISTVQAVVEQAIAAVAGQDATLTAAGRTDTGVHASGQVIAFDADWSRDENALLRAINAHLPPDIVLQTLSQCAGFHPRFDALARRYVYTVLVCNHEQPLLRHYSWQIRSPLAVDRMQQAASMVVGTHDFAAFGTPPQGESTMREIMLSVWEQHTEPFGARLTYTVEANAFLYHMVRRLVGMQVDVGRGRLSLHEFERIFRTNDRTRATKLAPPQGLVFANVRYPAII